MQELVHMKFVDKNDVLSDLVEVFVEDKAEVVSRVVALRQSLCILVSCFLSPIRRNSVFVELRVRKFAVIQEEICI